MRSPFIWMLLSTLVATGPTVIRAEWNLAAQPSAPMDTLSAGGVTSLFNSEYWSSTPVTLSPAVDVTVGPGEPATPFLQKNQPDLVKQLYEQVLELEPNATTRRAMERVREVAETTEVGVDTSREEWLESKDNLTLNWGGRIHTDWTTWANGREFGGQTDYLEFRRLRLMASGEGFGVFFYQLEFEFAPELSLAPQANLLVDPNRTSTGIEVKDAYLGMRDVAWLGTVRAGHFFTPLGMDSQTSSNYLTFMERSLVSRFMPGRELGISANSYSANQRLVWAYGIFAHEMRETVRVIENDNQGIRLIGRMAGTPFYDEASEGRYLFHAGLGYAYTRPRVVDDVQNPGVVIRPVEFDARPEVHRADTLISTGVLNTLNYHLVSTELACVNGPLAVQHEFVWANLDAVDRDVQNYYATNIDVSYFLTGENRPYNRRQGTFDRVIPYENCWFVRTPNGTSVGWGAWQLAGRWSYMDLRDVTDQKLHDLTLGANWYFNPHSRLMFNWVHALAHNSPIGTRPNSDGDVLSMRLQVDF